MMHRIVSVTPIAGSDASLLELDDASRFRLPPDAPAMPAAGDLVSIEVRDTPGCGPLRWIGIDGHEPVPEMRKGTAYVDMTAPSVRRVRVRAVTRPGEQSWIAFLDGNEAFASTGMPPSAGTVVSIVGGEMLIPDRSTRARHDPDIFEQWEAGRRAAHPLDPDRDQSSRPVVEGVGPNAPTIVHPNGSKESACLYALDVVPSVTGSVDLDLSPGLSTARGAMSAALLEPGGPHARMALHPLLDEIASRLGQTGNRALALLEVGRVLADGEAKYGDDRNWRGIQMRQHLRHALAHLVADAAGDRSEGEIGHLTRAFCRVAFAVEVAG